MSWAALFHALAASALGQDAAPPASTASTAGAGSSPVADAAAISPPLLASPAVAAWPVGAEEANDRFVMVLVTVGVSGEVEDAQVGEGAGEPLDGAALAAARTFRFTPARDASGPRRARLRVRVRFVGTGSAPSGVRTSSVVPAPSPPPVAPTANGSEPARVNVWGQAPPRSASETVIEERVLRAAPHRNASELMQVVPGVFVSQHSGEGKAHQIFFRGFDAVHGQDVEIWAGGAPVNEVSNVHGQGYADLHFLIPEVVQQIRSTPGVYDPRQGDFAVAGSLHFELGDSEPGVVAKASLGNFGRRRYFMAYRPETAPPETFAAFELESTDGFGPSRAARHGSAIAQMERDVGPVTARLMASTYAGRFDSAGVLRLSDIESGGVDRFATYDGKQGGTSSRTQLVLELRDRDDAADAAATLEPERWSLSPYVVFRTLRLRSNFTGTLTSPESDSTQQINEATTLGANGSYRRTLALFSERDSLEAGVALRSDAIRQSQHRLSAVNDRVTDDELTPGIDARVRATDAAGYLDVGVHPLPRLTLRAGLRADALSYMTEDESGGAQGQARSALGAQLSKRGTADVVLLPGLHALFSYGEGFRSPQARSLGDGETTPFTRVISLETGLRFRYEEMLTTSLALFYTRLSDDLVFDPTTARNELVPSTRRLGAAFNVLFEPGPDWVATGSVTYARASFEDDLGQYRQGDLLPYVPQLVGRADAAFTPTFGAVGSLGAVRSHFGVASTYIARRPLPYGEFGHDALLFDARASVRLGPLETGIDVYNLFDAHWYDGEFVYASAFGGAPSLVPERHVTVGAPRSFLWTLTLFV
ncbi:MAG TPA: TonB-dependent receptor [Polyangiaceae bacterium]|nr:TonB-dependent receptor [Polyangiaceae bacterium]